MSRKLANPQQMMLDSVIQVQCQCGCGEYFFAAKTPRLRQYINDTHKKRAARQREKLARTETRVKLTPKGWAYWKSQDPAFLEHLWLDFTPEQQAIIQMMCDTGMEPETLLLHCKWLFDWRVA